MEEYRGELLAPAGTMDCLKAAIAAGADAVYLGGQRFGARAFAGNFSREELLEGLSLAHLWNRKIYLTVNTLTKQDELSGLCDWIAPFYEAGLDGVIVQDMGVLEKLRKNFPGMELHASTQMTVTESRSALFLKSLGVCRIVPARELSLEEIRLLKEQTGLAMEVFIHGALCYCYSGQCLFSSFLGGRSGNRGRCAQPCRQPYTVLGQEAGGGRMGGKSQQKPPAYPLSLKDLCVLPFLPELMDAKIDSFKIEGRMKSPEYVAGVTAIYRKYMDLYLTDREHWQIDPEDQELLAKLYVRSETGGGYYHRHNGREMLTLEKPGYLACPQEILERVHGMMEDGKLQKPVSFHAAIRPGEPIHLAASCEGISVQKEGTVAQPAQKRPLAKDDVVKQLKKTGGSFYGADDISVELDGDSFVPVSALNELRRETLDALTEKLQDRQKRTYVPEHGREAETAQSETGESTATAAAMPPLHYADTQRPQPTQCYVSVLQAEQAFAALRTTGTDRLYLPSDLMDDPKTGQLMELVRNVKADRPGFELFVTLPTILRSYSEPYLKRLSGQVKAYDGLVDGFLAGSLGGMCWVTEKYPEKKLSLQHSVYTFNRETRQLYQDCFAPDSYTAPLELNRRELEALPPQNQEMVVYGRVPMMVSAGCVKRSLGACQISHTQKQLSQGIPAAAFSCRLKDRYNVEFPVWVNCRHCMNTIYNSVPLSLHQYLAEQKRRGIRAIRLDFTDETAEKTWEVLEFFSEGKGTAPAQYTTGHYKKGVQ